MTCRDCIHYDICYELTFHEPNGEIVGREACEHYKNKRTIIETPCRCEDCHYSTPLDAHCELDRTLYLHCNLWRGDEIKNVWHKYKKYYKDYSIVEKDGYCDSAE